MAYARRTSRRSYSTRAPSRRRSTRAPARRSTRRVSGRASPSTVRIVIEQAGASSVARAPAVLGLKEAPAKQKAKF